METVAIAKFQQMNPLWFQPAPKEDDKFTNHAQSLASQTRINKGYFDITVKK